jgi:hypothetical protein
LPLEQRYVRCAQTHVIERDVELKLVVCMMTSRMSSHLVQAKRLSIDTFKWAQGWQEFEIESWNTEHCRCESLFLPLSIQIDGFSAIVSARAFTTSQSAKAHLNSLSAHFWYCICRHWPPFFIPPHFGRSLLRNAQFGDMLGTPGHSKKRWMLFAVVGQRLQVIIRHHKYIYCHWHLY